MKAVIFDMYETLITLYCTKPYFGLSMAKDAGLEDRAFLKIWNKSENDRTLGNITFEEVIEKILKENNVYSKDVFDNIIEKRYAYKSSLFNHLHEEIIPMLEGLKKKDVLIGLVTNCYSEEERVIKESLLFPYFDVACFSCETGLKKPDVKIFERCMNELNVLPEDCLYIGDGGSNELESARSLNMKVCQATWYIKAYDKHPSVLKDDFKQLNCPLEILQEI